MHKCTNTHIYAHHFLNHLRVTCRTLYTFTPYGCIFLRNKDIVTKPQCNFQNKDT